MSPPEMSLSEIGEKEPEEIRELLEGLPYTEITQKEYTLAHIFRKNQNENFLSDWLAFLLDPTLFRSYEPLNAFLRLSMPDIHLIDENQEVTVTREFSFDDSGRIDLLIATDAYLIGIENKINAGFTGDNQLGRYKTALKALGRKGGKEAVGVLLSPRRSNVLHTDTDDDDFFVGLFYEDLIEEFKKISIDFVKNLRSAFLLRDYITYVEENVVVDTFDVEDKATVYLLDKADKVDKINAVLKRQRENYKKFIENAMEESAEKLGGDWEIFYGGHYWQLYKRSWKRDGIFVHYEVLADTRLSPKNSLAYTDYKLVIHGESRNAELKAGFKPTLDKAAQSIKSETFSLDFSSNENFRNSLNAILESLLDLVKETSEIIDEYMETSAPVSRE